MNSAQSVVAGPSVVRRAISTFSGGSETQTQSRCVNDRRGSDPEGQGLIEARFATEVGRFLLQASFSLPNHGVTALFGHSGSGKTTLLRCVAGLERAQRGFLQVGHSRWQDANTFCPPHRRSIGYVFQEASLLQHLSVQQNLCFGLQRSNVPVRISFDEVVDLLGLAPLLMRMPAKLSGGERQRVAVGRALLSQPSLLLMDEPLSALDARGKAEILPFLDSLSSRLQIPTLYVSHSLEEVCRLADRMVYLEAGRVADQGLLTDVVPRLPLGNHLGDESSVIEARILAHDPGHGLSYLDLQGHRLSVILRTAPLGARVRVRIPARDVALSLRRPEDSSMLNTFPVILSSFELFPDGVRMLIRLRCGDNTLLSKITRKSFDLLGLREGMSLYAQIKTVSLLEDGRLV